MVRSSSRNRIVTHGHVRDASTGMFSLNPAAVTSLSKKWYLALLRGFVALVAGLLVLALPTSAAMVLIAAYLFLDGAIAIAFGLEILSSPWIRTALVLEGTVGAVASIFVLLHGGSQTYLVFIVGMWAVVSGVLEIVTSTALPNTSWLIAALGLLSLVLGVVLFTWPLLAMMSFLYLLTSYTVMATIVFVIAGLILRRALVHPDIGKPPMIAMPRSRV